MFKFFATCPKGIEGLLKEEITALGGSMVKETVAGVAFQGEFDIGMKVCLWTRFATRVLLSIGTYHAESDLEFYIGAYNLKYEVYFDYNATIAVSFNGQNDFIRNTQYGALRIKDAVCDRLSKIQGQRPNVNKDNPDVRINVHLDKKNNVTVSLDLSGQSLHKRDYRTVAGIAPLKENLASAIVKKSGFRLGNVVDPMCGSATLLIEAAMQAANIAPGLFRDSYGFKKLKMFDSVRFDDLKKNAQTEARNGKTRLLESKISFIGFDKDESVIRKARENIERAGLSSIITVHQSELNNLYNPLKDKTPGYIICNPPYGERLGNLPELIEVYTTLGNKLKEFFRGWKVGVISSSTDLLSCLRLRYENKYKLFNGALECQLRTYSINQNNSEEYLKVEQDNNLDQVDLSNSEYNQFQKLLNNKNTVSEKDLNKSSSNNVSQSLDHAKQVAPDFTNRLIKNIKHLDKWAKREGLEAYRIYDADIPNYSAAIDRYGDYIVIQEYVAPKSVPEKVAQHRLLDMLQCTVAVTKVPGDHIILKVRERKKGDSQYEKLNELKHTLLIKEYGASFIVNLWDYLDTGIFLDHRLIRKHILENVKGKDFLNVFAYTGTATVYAALGGAKSTTTVDMSRTYLNWAKDNLKANNIKFDKHNFIQADCLQWVNTDTKKFDVIFADPPTFSNSKRMLDVFDVQRDHVSLIKSLVAKLNEGGTLIFSNNYRNFKLDYEQMDAMGLEVIDTTVSTIPEDFKHNKKIHNSYIIRFKK